MKGMTLSKIADAVGGTLYGMPEGSAEKEITGVELDSRKIQPGNLFLATKGERVDGHSFIPDVFQRGAAGVVCEKLPEHPGGPCILVSSSFQALEDMAEYYRKGLKIRVVGITGSVGKTSTKEAVAAVLSRKYRVLKTEGNLNNNVGLPLMVLRLREEHEAAVLELGISHFGEMERLSRAARPDIAVITNIGTSHIEFLRSREGILAAKSHIFDSMSSDGAIVLNGDDDMLSSYAAGSGRGPEGSGEGETVPVRRPEVRKFTFGRGPEHSVHLSREVSRGLSGSDIVIEGRDGLFSEPFPVHVPLPGPHMVLNALCAALIGALFQVPPEDIAAGIAGLHSMRGRSHIMETGGYTLIDDCYNASPASMCSALDLLSTVEGRRICILGDMLELGEGAPAMHEEVGAYTEKADPELVICVGALSRHTAEAAEKVLGQGRVRWYPSLEEFLPEAEGILRPGDTCLVKASLGMRFAEIVKKLSEDGGGL